ncbi:carboxypeptidase-like regulatory domain-containing protein [Altibacter sp. HG106]|uniref:carboxypeptidase-like regulatory domain-containing protein n=1 Tax=Altibacter sp. HG106 TaxID=3023937 RepID=UPI00234FC411|nr:carboxypeptidase-like regulatory domain-containing protein [Altibacter sp. HG106]MDC7995800.1 carboxypeptidase-like regulatory domain-containing protein [Altibacter sp. HG106]
MNIQIRTLLGVLLLITLAFAACEEDGIDEDGTGTIDGTVVVDGENTPLANVKITTNPASTTVFSDTNGQFVLTSVPSGDYSVQAELDDYLTAFEGVTVVTGEASTVVFELSLSSSTNNPPLRPVLVSPEDNASDVGSEAQFVWTSSDSDTDPIQYTFELRNGATNEILMVEEIEDTTYTVSDLTLGVNYFWQVTADDDITPPVESSISSFSTRDPNDNRFLFVRKVGTKNVIYSGSNLEDDEPDENVIQLTSTSENSFRPRKNNTAGKIAFLRTAGSETHLFTMNPDGTEVTQVTSTVPVLGFRQDEVDFSWFLNGNRIYYPNLNKLYSINVTGVGNTLIYEAPAGTFITEIDTNQANNLVAIKTNDANGYNARIVVINPNTGIETDVVIENQPGALGGIDYSIDGTKLLYTRDVSGFESPDYQQLDSRIFIYTFATDTAVEVDTASPAGTNDLDAKFSANEGAVIYVNTSNDGISRKDIYKTDLDNQNLRDLLFTESFMPDWE